MKTAKFMGLISENKIKEQKFICPQCNDQFSLSGKNFIMLFPIDKEEKQALSVVDHALVNMAKKYK